MSAKTLKGYVYLVFALLVLAAAVLLLLMNLDNDWRLKVFWRDRTMPRAGWLLLAAAAGVLLFWVLRSVLPAGVRSLRKGAAASKAKDNERRLSELEHAGEGDAEADEKEDA